MRRLSALPVVAPGDVGLDAEMLEDHRCRSRWQMELGLLPGLAECVISKEQVAYVDLQGNADLEHGTPMQPTTLFRCFSMTKPITAVALMRMVERKEVALDDPVSKYIPSFRNMMVVKPESTEMWGVGERTPEHLEPAKRPITLRHLLTHTAGLAYGPDRCDEAEKLKATCPVEESYMPLVKAVDNGKISTLEQFCDELASLPLRFHPGTRYLYSHGVDVVGRVIEVVSGVPLDVFLRQDLLKPLGMIHTTFSLSPGRAGDLAAMYKLEKEESDEQLANLKVKRVDGRRPEDSAWCGKAAVIAGGGMMGSCAGGLVSCLRDMALFCNMLLRRGAAASGEQILQQATVISLWKDWLRLRCVGGVRETVTMPGWTNGWRVGWSPLGHVRRHDKCLFMGGWSTSWAIYPRWKLATVCLSQSLYYFDVPAWDRKRDELDAVIEATFARRKRQRRAVSSGQRQPPLGRRRSVGGATATDKARRAHFAHLSVTARARLRKQRAGASNSTERGRRSSAGGSKRPSLGSAGGRTKKAELASPACRRSTGSIGGASSSSKPSRRTSVD